jgi:hypothetical protein
MSDAVVLSLLGVFVVGWVGYTFMRCYIRSQAKVITTLRTELHIAVGMGAQFKTDLEATQADLRAALEFGAQAYTDRTGWVAVCAHAENALRTLLERVQARYQP